MSRRYSLEELKRKRQEIEEELPKLAQQKEEIDQQYSAIRERENKLIDQHLKCRDELEYHRIDTQLTALSRRRRVIESKKEELERKLRGYKSELESIKYRIKYLTPKPKKFATAYEREQSSDS